MKTYLEARSQQQKFGRSMGKVEDYFIPFLFYDGTFPEAIFVFGGCNSVTVV